MLKIVVLLAVLVSKMAIASHLNSLQMQEIGFKIWYNEAAGKEELLVFWHENEAFPSLGIGHNIWLPVGQSAKFEQGFPILCHYLKQKGVKLPNWIDQALKTGAPWPSRAAFYQDYKRRNELRELLAQTVALQTQFMIDLMMTKLPLIVEGAPAKMRQKVEKNINLLLATPQGTYVLVDYLNFKGDGLSQKEELKGRRWGLLAVLMDMPANLTQEQVCKAFAKSAAKLLQARVKNAGPKANLAGFLPGWLKRLDTYV